MKKTSSPPVFKEYTKGQMSLMPSNLDESLPSRHVVRVVDEFVEKMDMRPLYLRYKGNGTSSYHPRMMLKVLIYAYTQRVFSSRQIGKALRENVPFMWLSGNSRPDFRTINRFRGEVLKGIIEEVFLMVLILLAEEGYIKLDKYFVDGTKLEANANKYTFVWKKNAWRFKAQVREKVQQLLEEVELINEEEDAEYGDRDLEELGGEEPIDSENLARKIAELNERMRGAQEAENGRKERGVEAAPGPAEESVLEVQAKKSAQKRQSTSAVQRLGAAIKKLEKDYLPRLRKYEEQEETLGERNSYSKTDTDATFMRMKDDPLGNGQLKPAYNIQLGTENQFIVGFSLHQRAGDTGCLIPHLQGVEALLGRLPEKIIADAGYGSEENYAYLEAAGVSGYIKYNTFDKEQKRRKKKDWYKAENFIYEPETDQYICPAGKRLAYRGTIKYQTNNGYVSQRRVYEGEDCLNCPVKTECTQAAGNRKIRVSFDLQRMKAQAREKLLSEEGRALQAQRGVDVEGVFGQIKQNWGFRRFLLRGLEKARTEIGLVCIANNIAKLAAL